MLSRRRLLVLLGCFVATPALAEERISIGTGGTGGLFYVIGAGMADVLNKNMSDASARAEVAGRTAGRSIRSSRAPPPATWLVCWPS